MVLPLKLFFSLLIVFAKAKLNIREDFVTLVLVVIVPVFWIDLVSVLSHVNCSFDCALRHLEGLGSLIWEEEGDHIRHAVVLHLAVSEAVRAVAVL